MTDQIQPVRKPKLLLVEDNDTYRKIVKNAMTLSGIDVIEAENGKRALELVQESVPDLILSDVYMPAMDGMSMLAALKSDPKSAGIRVVMVTNVQEELDAAVKGGAEEAVLKSSLTPHQLIDVCKKHLPEELSALIVTPTPQAV